MITPCPEGSLIAVHAQPRASRSEIVGPHGEALKVRLAAPPVDGAANQELLKFFAKALKIPRASIQLAGGESSRRKTLRVQGLAPDEVLARLGLAHLAQ